MTWPSQQCIPIHYRTPSNSNVSKFLTRSYSQIGMLIFKKFFSRVKNFNSRELNRVSMGITALWISISRKNYCGADYCVQAWRRVAMYSSFPRTVWVSRRVKCLDKRTVQVSWSNPPHAATSTAVFYHYDLRHSASPSHDG